MAGTLLFFSNDPFEDQRLTAVSKGIVYDVAFSVIEAVADLLAHDGSFFVSRKVTSIIELILEYVFHQGACR